jgi:hypothetical protein
MIGQRQSRKAQTVSNESAPAPGDVAATIHMMTPRPVWTMKTRDMAEHDAYWERRKSLPSKSLWERIKCLVM